MKKALKLSKLSSLIILALSFSSHAVEFNLDVIDTADKENIDFSRFSQAGYIMPGRYQMQVVVNGRAIKPTNFDMSFQDGQYSDLPKACITSDMISLMGLKEDLLKKVTYWSNGQCADFSKIEGIVVRPDIAVSSLFIDIPQVWLEYSDASWLPYSHWENGIPGLLVDYNLNASINEPNNGTTTRMVSYNGTLGANAGAWRLRADYQGSVNNSSTSDSDFDWNRFYAYRAIPSLQSNFMVGENYINSDVFSSWRYTGLSLESDERMLPPNLRGYAPQVTGIADTNARVVISQQGLIIYETTVPAGPFSIQDLGSNVRGRLNVEIIEQNGEKKHFQVDTAYVPYLTRPGQVRYKVVSGRSRVDNHRIEGPWFLATEASWGISNYWSLYGGAIIAGDYNALSIGLGRDLSQYGTISADLTQSFADLPDESSKEGKSFRVSYSKRFEQVDTDITFAGYRFSERDYMNMQQYLDARYREDSTGREKEMYTISVNKILQEWNASVGLQYNYQTYWDQRASNSYTFSVNNYFDVFDIKNVSLGLTASRSEYFRNEANIHSNDSYNDSIFFRLSIPLDSGTLNYSGNMSAGRYSQSVGYSDSINGGLSSYSINAGVNSGGDLDTQSTLSAYVSHSTPYANVSANITSQHDNYTSLGFSASGGATLTLNGGAFHAGGVNGSTRLLVDTDGVANVPIDGGRVLTNHWGVGVVTDMSSYYRNTVSVDLNKLPDNIEATQSVVESILTEGAIGYRKIDVLKGHKLFATLTLPNKHYPPFGTSVTNNKGRELGIIGDQGLVWLGGVNPGDVLNVNWANKPQCSVTIPEHINSNKMLMLGCQSF
ncbi:fimbria/pilus outer membrane usher protein [Photobacterium phosphoreum]|uniref:fimbria/pilus outer membrane usher protein n=1 Tax=Photobacterium phosphoreum TaxID=659 RepID=UPI0024B7F584|nr:fimbria/pilus outer membrane usher protein [Photobacterium phosphoreum]